MFEVAGDLHQVPTKCENSDKVDGTVTQMKEMKCRTALNLQRH